MRASFKAAANPFERENWSPTIAVADAAKLVRPKVSMPTSRLPAYMLQPIGPARFCRWIEGQPTPDDSCKCLAPSVPGVSYCPDHARRAFRAAGSPADFPTISPTP